MNYYTEEDPNREWKCLRNYIGQLHGQLHLNKIEHTQSTPSQLDKNRMHFFKR